MFPISIRRDVFNTIILRIFYEICTRKHDHIPYPDSAGARKGAKGSRKGSVRAVLEYHNFEQPPYSHIHMYMYIHIHMYIYIYTYVYIYIHI